MNTKKTVFVGLSGGVDSSVAALRLKQQGFNVVGVFIKVWHPDFLVCNWEQERLDAMRVAAHLDIPFLTCDAEKEYRDDVAKYFIQEYTVGRTPNPDVMCNKYVKFGAFLNFAKEKGADFIATGHYARRVDGSNGAELHRGIDVGKDQTYFLWTLTNEQLDYSLFPIGDTNKDKIRDEATQAGLPTARKKDSQGICFLGQVDIKDFLSHYVDLVEGDVLDEDGEVIGRHSGALVYTLGQRQGFVIHTKNSERTAYYVSARDIENNTITVSSQKPSLASTRHLTLTTPILRNEISVNESLLVQTRYRQTPFAVSVVSVSDGEIVLEVKDSTDAVASGQSCVLYRGTLCLGGGIIS
jgi:tRNA-specific 2-thiouridylase